ncbi:MAG: hypothetical protein IKA36_04600 [Clostridia bacterium]|nr:hypothetical protein [Clostridia bacterium]
MNKTKKGLLMAGSILEIITACLFVGLGILFICATGFVDFDVIKEILTEEGISHTENDINDILKYGKIACIIIGILTIIGAIALGAVSINLLNKTKKNIYSKKLNITLLVLSILISDMLVMAFMIACLVIKDEKPTLENIKEIGEEHNITADVSSENIDEAVEDIKDEEK